MTPSPRPHSFLNLSPHGFHRVVYWEWGAPDAARVIVCVHGLTRNGRDFDDLAGALSPPVRVICPDMPGRGQSDWLRDPNDYVLPTYLGVLSALIARIDADELAWVGTSMGGLLGMLIAGQPGSPITRLVINDIGPTLEAAAIARIGQYVGLELYFDSLAALELHLRTVCAPFGALTDAQWRRLAETSARRLEDGRYAPNYDPGIAVPFRATNNAATDLWPIWEAITCPTLVVRGAESDLLTRETAHAMCARGPRASLVEIPGVGHAPTLQDPAQIEPVAQFLQSR
jgi:pimeloyl-ACP methyl ester carboxylesterase